MAQLYLAVLALVAGTKTIHFLILGSTAAKRSSGLSRRPRPFILPRSRFPRV